MNYNHMQHRVGDKLLAIKTKGVLVNGERYEVIGVDEWGYTLHKIGKAVKVAVPFEDAEYLTLDKTYTHNDAIKPDYYQFHGYDVFDIAEHFCLSFPLGNALKYLLRCKYKENEEQDLRKAIKCIERHLEMVKRDKQGGGED